jgi:NAD(P)-dependent dehydrogenase (short-subunit alcohol dehydrogenase family)
MKKILITGATGAVGSALAKQLAAGHALALTARQTDKLQTLGHELPSAQVMAADLVQSEAAEALVQEVWQKLEGIDALAHCVGSTLIKPLHLISPAAWQEQFDLNVSTTFHVTRAVVSQALKARTPLSIVLVSSVVAHAGFANHEAVAAAKAAVTALGQSIAATYADKGIRVNIVAPGLTRSSLTQRFIATPEAEARSAALIPTGRIGEPEEVAQLIAFLLSDASRHITGQVIGIDGGQGVLHVPAKPVLKAAS